MINYLITFIMGLGYHIMKQENTSCILRICDTLSWGGESSTKQGIFIFMMSFISTIKVFENVFLSLVEAATPKKKS